MSAQPPQTKTVPLDPDHLTDALGTRHAAVALGQARIVCLVPSITELLCDLGLGASLVGRTRYCIHPSEGLRAVPSVGGTKKIHIDQVAAARPTHAILNIDENTEEIARQVEALVPHVVVTHPLVPLDNVPLYRFLGRLFGCEAAAEVLVARFSQAYTQLEEAAAGWPARRVLYAIWKNPWMTVSRDTYVSNMLALARLHTAGHDPARRYPTVSLDDPAFGSLDAWLLSSEPYPFGEQDMIALAAEHPPAHNKTHLINGEFVSWYGSRAIAGLDYLRGLVPALWP